MQQQIINVYPVYKEITAFFHIEDLKSGSSKKAELLYGDKSYAAEISVDTASRAKLSWGYIVVANKLRHLSKGKNKK